MYKKTSIFFFRVRDSVSPLYYYVILFSMFIIKTIPACMTHVPNANMKLKQLKKNMLIFAFEN